MQRGLVNAASTLHPAWLAVAGVCLLLGLWLLRSGWRGRRVGDEPYCGKCGYSLKALPRERCPECGADVSEPKGVRTGVAVRQYKVFALGAVLSVVAATVLLFTIWQRAQTVDWYTFKPTSSVLDDLSAASSPNRQRAWKEIQRRMKDGATLGKGHQSRLVDIALADHLAFIRELPFSPLTQDLVHWLQTEAAAGRITETQRAKLCEQSQLFPLRVRPIVVRGDPVPYELGRREFGLPGSWAVRVTDASLRIDGALRELRPEDIATLCAQAELKGGRTGHEIHLLPWRTPPLEQHELAFTFHVEVRDRWSGTFLHAYDAVRKARLDVVPDSSGLWAPADAATETKLRAAFRSIRLRLDKPSSRRLMDVNIEILFPPTDISFSAFAGEREYPLGLIQFRAGGTGNTVADGLYTDVDQPTKMDLVLRPDESAAREQVDLLRIWSRELVFKDVPVLPLWP